VGSTLDVLCLHANSTLAMLFRSSLAESASRSELQVSSIVVSAGLVAVAASRMSVVFVAPAVCFAHVLLVAVESCLFG